MVYSVLQSLLSSSELYTISGRVCKACCAILVMRTCCDSVGGQAAACRPQLHWQCAGNLPKDAGRKCSSSFVQVITGVYAKID